MRQVSLREFRTRGSKALENVPQEKRSCSPGKMGRPTFLFRFLGDVAAEDRELRRAMAKASLRESWTHAKSAGLDQLSNGEIENEIKQVRAGRKRRKSK